MSNIRFANAIKKNPQKIPPVWFMRQAGRYHKHYQKLRAKHDFIELCKNVNLAAEVTMGPIEDFDFDVAILFSDLLFPLEAMGMGLKYAPGPMLEWQLTPESIKKLRPSNEAAPALLFQKHALEAIRKRLPQEKSLIGFVGGPWTLFTYAVEGQHAGHLIKSKTDQRLFHKFCEILLPLLKQNIEWQLEGGAEVVMLFDTAAGELAPDVFLQVVAPYLGDLCGKFPGVLGYYSKGTTEAHYQSPIFRKLPWAGLGFDHRWNLHDCYSWSPGFVQGNFDQTMLFAKPDEFKVYLQNYLTPFLKATPEQRAGWVCGLGHGVLPETPEENVRVFVRTIRELFA